MTTIRPGQPTTTPSVDRGDGPQTTPQADAPKDLEVKTPQSPDDAGRTDIGRQAAEKLIDIVTQHKDVAGTGQESAAQGDPRVTERRDALSTLIAEKSGRGLVSTAMLESLGDNVKNDIKWLMAADRSEYKVDGDAEQFGWAKSNMSSKTAIKGEFDTRVKDGKKQAEALKDESATFFDTKNGTVIGLSFIEDTKLRSESMMDALLQFRARTDPAEKPASTGYSSYTPQTRIDKIAPAQIAEQRVLLASADLSLDDESKVREFALLREVIASHPLSSVNGVFDARNAIGKLYMDGARGWDVNDHAMAWLKTETPPGGTFSAYSAIHHNFSRDTPRNISLTISEWVLPHGPKERRPNLFLKLCDAIEMAQGGAPDKAKEQLQKLDAKDKKTLKPLLDKLADADAGEVAGTIALWISQGAGKPLAAPPRDVLKAIAKIAKEAGGSYAYQPEVKYKQVRDKLAEFGEPTRTQIKDLLDACKDAPDKELEAKITGWLDANPDTELVGNVSHNLKYFARTYRSICQDQPSIETLEADLFHAGDAWPEVADVIAQMRSENDLGTLKDLGEARLAMRDAIIGAGTGFERHELIKFDADIARLTCTELGAAVDRVGNLKTDEQKTEALIGVQCALRAAVASGLHALRDPDDPKAQQGRQLDEVLKDVDAAMDSGKINEDDYRSLMAETYTAVARCVQNMRHYADKRAVDVASGGAELDPMFMDQFTKQSPLHYATALAEKGMRAGLKEEIGARRVANVEGMRVLNSVGPVVFENVVFANNTKDLVDMHPPRDALSVLYKLEEKKMVAVGGLITDVEHAPGGNSHLNMYAMNNGITVLALPELQTKYVDFFAHAEAEGGIYVDDSGGQMQMMTVDYAKEQGLLDDAKIEDLRPGTNKRIKYLAPASTADTFELLSTHESIVSSTRPTREIELYVPADEVRGIGRECTSFDDLASLGTQARHLAGEKGTVLALLRNNPKLRPYVPDGSQITTGRVRGLAKECGLDKDWNKIWLEDPEVGVVDEQNWMNSAFYTDNSYRAKSREHLQKVTTEKLTKHLLAENGDGTPKLTDAGEKLYGELMVNDSLANSLTGSIIKRSSFTGEDRPGKSGAGQYESYVDRGLAKKMYGKDKTDAMYETYGKARGKLREFEKAVKDAEKAVEEAKKANNQTKLTEAKKTLEEAQAALAPAQAEFAPVRDAHIAFMGPPRIQAAIGVIESTWMPEPIENNVADDVNLQHIECSVAVQDCLTPSISGVVITRNTENGARNQISYQLVKGFGGGVEGGKTEEGVVNAAGHEVGIEYPDEPDGLATPEKLAELREICLEVERYFNEVIEPGKGHAVDMEVAMQEGEWKIVQARVILMDH